MSTYENQRFMNDPLKYARDVCINLQTKSGHGKPGDFDSNQAYTNCYFDLVPWSSSLFSAASQVMLEPATVNAVGLIPGYYVPYLSYGTITSNGATPVLLDNIPATLPPQKFIFTGGQNGCSLLLLTGTAPNTVAALHYPNSDGKAAGYPLLAQVGRTAANILIAIDFDLYGQAENPNACSFFYYNGTRWIGVTQPQTQGVPDMSWKRNTMSLNKTKGAYQISPTGQGPIA